MFVDVNDLVVNAHKIVMNQLIESLSQMNQIFFILPFPFSLLLRLAASLSIVPLSSTPF